MKQKTNKLRRLETKRFSILTNNLNECYLCGKPKQDLHEIYSSGSRKQSMVYGFVIPLCRLCHQNITLNSVLNLQLKQICQKEYEKEHTRDEFLAIIHKNYL